MDWLNPSVKSDQISGREFFRTVKNPGASSKGGSSEW